MTRQRNDRSDWATMASVEKHEAHCLQSPASRGKTYPVNVKAPNQRLQSRRSAAPSVRKAGGTRVHTFRRPPSPTPAEIAESLDLLATLGSKSNNRLDG